MKTNLFFFQKNLTHIFESGFKMREHNKYTKNSILKTIYDVCWRNISKNISNTALLLILISIFQCFSFSCILNIAIKGKHLNNVSPKESQTMA